MNPFTNGLDSASDNESFSVRGGRVGFDESVLGMSPDNPLQGTGYIIPFTVSKLGPN